jgi:hypothetical protein
VVIDTTFMTPMGGGTTTMMIERGTKMIGAGVPLIAYRSKSRRQKNVSHSSHYTIVTSPDRRSAAFLRDPNPTPPSRPLLSGINSSLSQTSRACISLERN